MNPTKSSPRKRVPIESIISSEGLPESDVSSYVEANIDKFTSTMLRSLDIDVGDINCICCVIRGIVLTIPDIMQKYIELHGKSSGKLYVGIKLPSYFVFKYDEVRMMEDAIKAEFTGLAINLVGKRRNKLDETIYQLFLEEKMGPLRKFLEYTFSQAMSFREYIIDFNKSNKLTIISEKKLLAIYVFESEQFRCALKNVCLSVLTPPVSIIKLSNLLRYRHLDMGAELSEDFSRETLEMATDTIGKFIWEQEGVAEIIATKLFEKHKYLYLCDYVENMDFTGVVQPLCLMLKGIRNDGLDRVIASFNAMFTYIEISVIKKYLNRMEQGLLKLSPKNRQNAIDQSEFDKRYLAQEGQEDLLNKIKSQLKVDLREREGRHKKNTVKPPVKLIGSKVEPIKFTISLPQDEPVPRTNRLSERRIHNASKKSTSSQSAEDVIERQADSSRSPRKSPRKSPGMELTKRRLPTPDHQTMLNKLDVAIPTDLELNASTSMNITPIITPKIEKKDMATKNVTKHQSSHKKKDDSGMGSLGGSA